MLCQYPGCLVELPPQEGRGRRTKRCPEHRKVRKREQDKAKYERDKARINSEKPQTISEGILYPCCIEWRQAGRANRTTCPQHKQWHIFCQQSRDYYRTSIRHNGDPVGQDRDTLFSLMVDGVGFRVSADPDSWQPIDRDDKQQDKALTEWIDAGMPGAAEMKEIYANEAAKRLSHIGRLTRVITTLRDNMDDDMTKQCPLALGGKGPYPSHCRACINRLRPPRGYQVYDYLGRVIVADRVDLL